MQIINKIKSWLGSESLIDQLRIKEVLIEELEASLWREVKTNMELTGQLMDEREQCN